MDHQEIQKRLDAMPAAMSAKGLGIPDAHFTIRANAANHLYLTWKGEDGYAFFYGETAEAIVAKAEAHIAALPSAEETKRNTFLSALGKVIDLGNEMGQDVGVLASEMKRLASNAITDQRNIQPAE